MAQSLPIITFHLFSHLPPEVRDHIWFFCLPCRVVPLDDPVWLERYRPDSVHNSVQQCWLTNSQVACRAEAPPLIASVCREARQVAFRWGGVEDIDTSVSLRYVWIQRKLDTLLFGWTYNDSVAAGHDEDKMELFLWGQRRFDPVTPVCLFAYHFFKFDSNPSAPENGYTPNLRWDEVDMIAFLLCNAIAQDDIDIPEDTCADLSDPMDVDVVMETIYIHATRADVLASQLFGRIADEPAQLVDYDDVATLAQFRTLFNCNLKNQRRMALIKRFDAIESSEFPAQVTRWLAKVAWKLLALKWLHEKQHNPQSSIYRDPMQVFNRNPSGDTFLSMEIGRGVFNHFKVDHPWVVEEIQRLPKLRPKIWFMYCTKDCKVKTEPEEFGW